MKSILKDLRKIVNFSRIKKNLNFYKFIQKKYLLYFSKIKICYKKYENPRIQVYIFVCMSLLKNKTCIKEQGRRNSKLLLSMHSSFDVLQFSKNKTDKFDLEKIRKYKSWFSPYSSNLCKKEHTIVYKDHHQQQNHLKGYIFASLSSCDIYLLRLTIRCCMAHNSLSLCNRQQTEYPSCHILSRTSCIRIAYTTGCLFARCQF